MQIVKTLLLLYLRRYPNRLRLSQFNFLSQYSWMQNVLAEIKGDLFPSLKKEASLPPEILVSEQPQTEVLQILSADIRGQRGIYHVDRWLCSRGNGYLFTGMQVETDRAVVIKEYLLNQQFYTLQELRDRQDVFKNLAGIALADGRIQDLRVIAPLEAIADTHASHRCYLITDAYDAAPSLRQRLLLTGPLDPQTVRHILLQILQTLELLHQQKFRLPSGKTQLGLPHGNLTLESILWVDQGDQMYVYLTDFALWEKLFAPPHMAGATGVPEEMEGTRVNPFQTDLAALGHIGFALLVGQADTNTDPQDETAWPPSPPSLKEVLCRLMGIMPPFKSAAEARQALLSVPDITGVPVSVVDAENDLVAPSRSWQWLLFLLLLGGVGLGVGLWWSIWGRSPLTARTPSPRSCCLADIEAMPSGQFFYTYVESGSWEYILKQRDLGKRGWSLKDHLRAAYPNLDLVGQPSLSIEAAIAQVQSGKMDFAIIPQLASLPIDLDSKPIAYDGLAVFVAFSYARRNQGLPAALNGVLSLDELQQLYRGEIDNWQQVGRSRLPVKLYAPTNPEARQIFEQLVLQGQSLDDLNALNSIDIQTTDTFDMLRSIIRDFEQPQTSGSIGGIGFSYLSRIFGQCSVYPLAIDRDGEGQTPVQPLVLKDGEPIQPGTDLCDRKGTYAPDISVFQTEIYPLAYPLVIVFPQDNSLSPIGPKFVEVLTTIDGQRLLQDGSLIPLEAIDDSVDKE